MRFMTKISYHECGTHNDFVNNNLNVLTIIKEN